MKYDIDNLSFRDLTAEELNVKVSNCSQYGSMFLLYKDARVDAQILNETVGAGNWMNDHKQVKDTMFGSISIRNQETGEWVTKWDAGVPSFAEAEKGEASDSFKRAGFKWGIGTKALYNSPDIKIKSDVIPVKDKGEGKWTLKHNESLRVLYVDYKDHLIDKLIIERKDPDDFYKWHECFRYPKNLDDSVKTTTTVHNDVSQGSVEGLVPKDKIPTKTTQPATPTPAATQPKSATTGKGLWNYTHNTNSKYAETWLNDTQLDEIRGYSLDEMEKTLAHWTIKGGNLRVSSARLSQFNSMITEARANQGGLDDSDREPEETLDDLPF